MTTPSARLIYRPPTADDAARLFAIYSDPRTQSFNPAGPMKSVEQAHALLAHWIEHWQRHGFGWWAIAVQHTPEHVIGFGGVAHYDYLGELRLNLGYRFAPEAWGQGYATEMGRQALDHAFARPEVRRVWAVVRPDHAASIKVLVKLGMKPCGVLDDVPGQPESLLFCFDR
ncbi:MULTISPECIES: GNAT family N-acetyltransferase [unclassified Pseudomonas]|uniref:GNAT family N-acetyltransferase n=1 Tax=unclassified Pseudomonas TaxID=196821 RepID=UPI000D347BD6|nr:MULTISPECIES: GNAT family N-acetyltransferase [unclassified Pseudomonas]RAU44586.1 N-acetyltransferase [Pseudomonas sp. RIT 409]RAU54978.1 N-acetyltransferase [Pseudomonas sp. RIT 412]